MLLTVLSQNWRRPAAAAIYGDAPIRGHVLPLDNSTLTRWNTPRPSLTAGRTVFTYSGELIGTPASAALAIVLKAKEQAMNIANQWMNSISLRRRDLGLGALALGAAATLPQPSVAESRAEKLGQFLKGELGELKDLKDDVKEEVAYLLGMECYVYGFPLVMMDVTNGVLTATSKSGEYKAPINQFGRIRTYVSPDFKDVVRISVNSLWSFAVLDLDKEPLVASHPDTKGRYIVLQLMNMWTDDFGSIGSRTTGTGAGNFLLAGPKWNGTAPSDIKDVYRCPTRFAWLLVQMSAAGPQDFPEIHAPQDQLQLTPLSAWGKPYTPPDDVPINPAVDLTATPYDQVQLMTGEMFFKRLALLLKDNPP